MNVFTLQVVEIRKETEETLTLCFKQPALRKVRYLAGQYLTLIFRINGRRYIRPYSFSSAPAVDKLLEITIKRVPNGIVSNHIHDIVQVGDSIEVMQPMGDFIFEKVAGVKEVFLWGVGSGITPLISLVKQLLAEYPDLNIKLAYGNRNHQQTIFISLIQELQQMYADRFKVWHFHTQCAIAKEYPFLVEGRITVEGVMDIMKDVSPETTMHYICGPLGLKESVKEALTNLNVSNNQIFSEDFELIKDPKDFENIITQEVRLLFEGRPYTLEVVKGKSILESALDAGIELPYSCQTGNCSTCKGKLITGQTKMIGLGKDRSDLLKNECLLCCTHPITNNVYIEI